MAGHSRPKDGVASLAYARPFAFLRGNLVGFQGRMTV
jgi:hypothetical protein